MNALQDAPTFTLLQIANALDVPIARVRTMRARGQSAMWDSGSDAPDDGGRTVARQYSLTDATALACTLEFIERGMTADMASGIASNCRHFIHDGPHPRAPHRTDVWIGALLFPEGRAHVGGQRCDLFLNLEDRIRRERSEGSDVSGLLLVNASRHFRSLKEKLSHGD